MSIIKRHLGVVEYGETFHSMRTRIAARHRDDPDEFWFLEHYPVYTLGQAGKREHILRELDIPVVKTDRGGQVTYHGPGQLVIYTLLDLRRHKLGPRSLVNRLEEVVIQTLEAYGISGKRRDRAPGVYVDDAKIASLGLRIRNGFSYHGLALNVDMDLGPFTAINPCGYSGLRVTQMRDLGVDAAYETIVAAMEEKIVAAFGGEQKQPEARAIVACAVPSP